MRPTPTEARVVRSSRHRRTLMAITPVVLALTQLPLATTAQSVQPLSNPPGQGAAPLPGPTGGAIELKARRLPDAVELVIEGVGSMPQLQQTTRGASWEGMLFIAQPGALRRGPQSFSLAEAGFQSISISGAGRGYRLQVSPMPGGAVPRPVVSADGRDLILSFSAPSQPRLQTASPSLTTPGAVPQTSFVPPLQPRAVAPPVGDIAVGTMMLANPSYLQVRGKAITINYSGPASAFLKWISQQGGYSFVFVDDCKNPRDDKDKGIDCDTDSKQKKTSSNRWINLRLQNEEYSKALNSALLAAGLQGKLSGRVIFAGTNVLGISLGGTMSKVFRLNQVSADSASDYLASLGASINKVTVVSTSVTVGTSQGNAIQSANSSATTTSSKQTTVESFAASQGPLKGLIGSSDSRLGTITLVGDPRLVAVAESYLRQLDLRQRQVALSVKILDVTLDNDTAISNSFAFRYGNNFIVNDRGQLVGAFGSLLPPQGDQFGILGGSAASAKPEYITVNTDPNTGLPILPVVQNPLASAPVNPGSAYPNKPFFDLVRAQIESRSTKVLASPTLILTDNPQQLREGGDQTINAQTLTGGGGNTNANIGRSRANEGFVTVGEQVITNYSVQAGQNGAPNTCQPQFGVSGLTFGARVSKIDDNGFVTFSISPTITATTRQQQVPNCGPIDILAVRSLDSGGARVRDGQTLIMTGVISDLDTQTVRKWPILGDMPLIGQFFRDTTGGRRKRELVILVTPRILRDDQGGAYGYGYQPSTPQSRDFVQQAGG